MRSGRAFLVWALIALLSTVSLAGSRDDDQALEKSVREALSRSGVDVAAVVVEAHDGIVVLKGTVRDARDKLELIQAAFRVSEVREVQSQLGVRVGMTPDLEEAVWAELLKGDLGANVTEVLVRDGVASLKGEASDGATRDRVLATVKSVPGIRSVENEIALSADAESVPAPPAPPTAEPAPESPEPPQETPEEDSAEPPSPSTPPLPTPPEPENEPASPVVRQAPSMRPPAPAPAPTPTPAPAPEREPEPPPSSLPATPAPTSTPPTPTPRVPPRLAQQVAYHVVSYPGYTVFDNIEFGIEGKDVVLRGTVTSPSKKREIEERVKAISGIGDVRSDVRILPESKADDQLRERLFRQIYEDQLFAEHAKDPNPPVHIIVEQGWVTLTGLVDELVQKMSAEARVRNVFEVVGVRNQIRVRDPMAPRR